MMFQVLFVGLLATFAFAYPSDSGRIVGGHFAVDGEIPYIVSIREFANGQWGVICSGSILNSRFILSAAHCFKNPNDPENYRIQYGQIDKFSRNNLIDVEKIANHPNYSPNGLRPADIAILKLADDIRFTLGQVEPVELGNGPVNIPGDSINARLAGWGRDENNQKVRFLKVAEFPMFSDAKCREFLKGAFSPDLHLCAGNLDGTQKQCSGDSGGPLMANGQQHGVVAWSVKPCTTKNMPGIFTRVWVYRNWIDEKLRSM